MATSINVLVYMQYTEKMYVIFIEYIENKRIQIVIERYIIRYPNTSRFASTASYCGFYNRKQKPKVYQFLFENFHKRPDMTG